MAQDTFTKEKSLEREIRPAVEGNIPGIDVLALELVSPGRFCVYIDHPQGVDHALCERVTYLLDRWRADYAIEVSSPGPEPPVRRAEHFRRAVGRQVRLKTRPELAGKTTFRGAVVAADERQVTVETAGSTLVIPYETIVRGNLIDEGVGGA